MNLRAWGLTLCLALPLSLPAFGAVRTVTFENATLGTVYGAATGTPLGTLIATEDTIEVRSAVYMSGGTPFYLEGQIELAGAVGNGQLVGFSNIGLTFDFHGAGDVSFEFRDSGGSANIRVNGLTLFEVADYRTIDGQEIAPGVMAQVSAVASGATVGGTVTLTGPVSSLHLAGAELQVDNVSVDATVDSGGGSGEPSVVCDVIVDHETLNPGDSWNAPAAQAGDLIFVEDAMEAHILSVTNGAVQLLGGILVAPAAGVGTGQVLELTQAAVGYDLAGQGFSATSITFVYGDNNQAGNLTVNGATTFVGDLLSAPVAIAPGVTLAVAPLPGSAMRRVTLAGPLSSLGVGGLDFVVDDMCFVLGTGPVYGGCDKLVTGDDLTAGEVWSNTGAVPGDVVFTEDDVAVGLAAFDDGLMLRFETSAVAPALADFGTGNIISAQGMTVVYDFRALGEVVQVNLDYKDIGGLENLQINGSAIHIGQLAALPAVVAPGVGAIVVEAATAGGSVGRLILSGPVELLRIGGEDLYLDNVCVRVNGPTSSGVPDIPAADRMLAAAYPNPFNPSTELRYTLTSAETVTLAIYDLNGRLVRTLVDHSVAAGEHTVLWRGRDNAGRIAPSGVYFARLHAAGRVESQKISLIK